MKECNKIPDEVQGQLDILDNSENLLVTIIIGTLIRLGYLGQQKNMLIKNAVCPNKGQNINNGFCIELISSLLIIYGLFGFYNQSKDILSQSYKSQGETRNQCIDTVLSKIVLAVALIRLYQLFTSNNKGDLRADKSSGLILGEI